MFLLVCVKCVQVSFCVYHKQFHISPVQNTKYMKKFHLYPFRREIVLQKGSSHLILVNLVHGCIQLFVLRAVNSKRFVHFMFDYSFSCSLGVRIGFVTTSFRVH